MKQHHVRLLIALLAIAAAAFPAIQHLPSASAAVTPITVNSAADPGDGTCDVTECTLREAINEANANANPGEQDVVQFNIPGAGPHVISITSALPPITQAVHLNGQSEPGASCDIPGRTLQIEVRAGAAGLNGIVANHSGAPGTMISGLAVTGFGFSGLSLGGGAAYTVRCNHIGIQADGATLGNGDGIFVSSSPSSVIGGDAVSHRNVISGSANNGLALLSSGGTIVRNNYIGVNQDGTAAVTNTAAAIYVSGSQNVEIRSNVVASPPGGFSISVVGNSSNSVIQGNMLGYLANGTTPAAANLAMRIYAGDGFVSSGHTIGGVAPGEANRIYALGATAVDIVVLDSGVSNNNSIRGNSIRAVTLGIALTPVDESSFAITDNDNGTGDADDGPNRLQNYPVLSAVSTDGTVTGDLDSAPSSTFFLDFYAGPGCFGRDGERYLGSKTVITDANGDASFVATGLSTFLATESVTATATDSSGNTSEFSACLLPPARSMTGIDPSEAVVGSADTLVTVTGVAFVDGDQVTISGNAVATTFVNSTTLEFVVPSNLKSGMGTLTIGIDDISEEINFTVTRSSSDIDCSGNATSDDALMLLRTLAGLESPVDACPDDANLSSGAPTIADVLHIRSEVAGLVQPLKSLFQQP